MEQSQTGGNKCQCQHHSILPLFVTLIGLTFLLHALMVLNDYATGLIWPILLLAAGLTKMIGHRCRCCGSHA